MLRRCRSSSPGLPAGKAHALWPLFALSGRRIVYTGGMAHSDRLCREISSYVGPLAPVLRFPGEFEMQALAAGALRVLYGQPALNYCP